MILLQISYRITAITQVMAYIQTHADTRIQILRMLPDVGCIRISLDIGSVQMDRIMEIIFFYFLIHIRQQLIIRNTDNQLHSYPFGIFESPVDLRLALHVNWSHGITGNAEFGTTGMESLDLFVRTIQWQMEILDTQIMDIQSLHRAKRRVQVEIDECITCHSQLERID